MLRNWKSVTRTLFMKNGKKTIFTVLAVILLAIGCIAGYKGFHFAKEKYHYLREHLDYVEDLVSYEYERNYRHYDFDYSWAEDNTLVAHAMGAYDGDAYTNSIQAFQYNYDLGYRVFEVDLDLSLDHYLICSHDEKYWRQISQSDEDVEYSLENFKARPINGDLNTLDGKDLVELLHEYPDIYVITDNKYTDEFRIKLQFTQLLNYAKEIDLSVMNRIIPQIYSHRMLDYVMEIYDFKSVIYTLYQDNEWETETMALFCSKTGVGFITMGQNFLNQNRIDIWNRFGIKTAVHTIDDPDNAKKILNMGVTMIYSNRLKPEDFK